MALEPRFVGPNSPQIWHKTSHKVPREQALVMWSPKGPTQKGHGFLEPKCPLRIF